MPKPAAPPATMRTAIDMLTARSEELDRIDITKLSDEKLIYHMLDAEPSGRSLPPCGPVP